jgi:hypothetical protein
MQAALVHVAAGVLLNICVRSASASTAMYPLLLLLLLLPLLLLLLLVHLVLLLLPSLLP